MSSNETFDTDIVDISEFFNSGDSFNQEGAEAKTTFNEVDSPIKELKAIILSLDWEITSEIADSFIEEVDRLSDVWHSDKTVISFLHILRALGKYLRTHKADAHPGSIKLLYSVYNNFEKIVLTNEISEEQEQQILREEIEKFHDLKEKIALAATATSEGKANESLLSALKTLVLEIDWQITNQTMQKFDIEIGKLERIWHADKNFLTLLQMMRAIGSYINKNKRNSLPDSIKLLSTVFHHFEQMALSEDLSPAEQQEFINDDLEKFSHLKKQIAAVKKPPSPESIIESLNQEVPKVQAPKDLPAQIYDEEDTQPTADNFGHVEPISFDSEDDLIPPARLSGDAEGEVNNRLNDLFGASEEDFEEGKPLSQDTLAQDDNEVSGRLNDLFAETDKDVAFNSGDINSSLKIDEVTPLPPTDTVDIDLHSNNSEKIFPGEINDDRPLDHDTPPVTALPDNMDADFFQADAPTSFLPSGEKQEVPGIHRTEKIEKEDPPEKKPTVCKTAVLQKIVNSAENMDQLNIGALTNAIGALQDSLHTPTQQILLQIMQSMTLYAKNAVSDIHPDCFKLINVSSQILAKSENPHASQNSDSLDNVQSTVKQYIDFQNSIIFPAVADFMAKEKEIKKILGLTS